MTKKILWTRRNFLRTSLATTALPLLPVTSVFAEKSAEKKSANERKLFLFVDWFHVKKGDREVTLDPERVSEKGRKLLGTYSNDFKKIFDQSGHGFKSLDVPFGIRITQEVAQRSKPWLVADQPWEENVGSPTVIFDEGKFRCWYAARLKGEAQKITVESGRVMEVSGSALAYAESKDGFNWTKPILNILSYQGSTANNLVSPFNSGGAVFRDDHGPAEERYKGFHFDELPKDEVAAGAGPQARYGLYGCTSPDGYHWKKNPKPLIRYFADTINIAAWDSLMGKYVGFFRHHLSGRTISRSETENFWEWPAPQPLLYAGPMDSPADDYYTSGYTTYPGEPSLRLIFPAIYHHDDDTVDVRLGISRDGRAFQWISYKPIIQLGKPDAVDGGSIYAEPNLVQLSDGRLALPYNVHSTTHNEVFFKSFYGDYKSETAFGWATWKEARLAGIEAEQVGQFTMISGVFKGDKIEINARTTRGGGVEVELRAKGKTLEGFGFTDCVPFRGDEVWATCRWKNKSDLSELKGKSIEVVFKLNHAKIFACRFN